MEESEGIAPGVRGWGGDEVEVYGFCVRGVAEGHCAGDEGAPVAALDDFVSVLVYCI